VNWPARGATLGAANKSRRRPGLAVLLAGLLVLAGCSGVPRSSRPEVVQTIPGNASAVPSEAGPAAGDEPRTIVQGFLNAAAESSDAKHSSARQYLTTEAGSKWLDSSVTVVADFQVQFASSADTTSTVAVNVQAVGHLDNHGIYTPVTKGVGEEDNKKLDFELVKVNGAWRINQLPAGVIIRSDVFAQTYSPRLLYFFDPTLTTLIPDVRYTALEGEARAQWLLAQLLQGPRPELIQSVQSEVPAQVDARPAAITLDDRIEIELPGTSQLDDQSQERLAYQLANTFGQIAFSSSLRLTDSGKVVDIPNIGSVFSAESFPAVGTDAPAPGAQSYYLRNGGLISGATDKPVAGPVGSGAYGMTSVAVRRADAGGLLIAGLSPAGLLIGSSQSLSKVALPPGTPGRPEWQPRTSNVWLGVGNSIYRVGPDRKPKEFTLPTPVGGLPSGQIESFRFSPDGIRLAVIVRSPNGVGTLWIGSVTRIGANIGLDNFAQITPSGMSVDDVSWKDSTTMLMIASMASDAAQVWTVQSDGYNRQTLPSNGLPLGLLGIAVAPGQPAVVSSADPAAVSIQQAGGGWVSLGARASAPTYAP
jgi:hypothetical protein